MGEKGKKEKREKIVRSKETQTQR